MPNIKCFTPADVLSVIAEFEITFIDLKFSDPFGQLQHIAIPTHEFSAHSFEEGIAFDGSSIRGWKDINESDMQLIPVAESTYLDPFITEPTLSILCDVVDPLTKEPYDRDSRQIAKKVVAYLQTLGIGDQVYFGPEAEFFIFDKIKFGSGANYSFYEVDSEEAIWNSGKDDGSNIGYKIPHKRGYFPVAPLDKTADIRLEMMRTLEEAGIVVERGHHEVGTAGQAEINIRYNDLVTMGDEMAKFKYILRNVGAQYGKYVTFLPKPLAGDNGSGMHCHLSIWKDGKNTFAGGAYAGLSETALFAIGGIIKHGRAMSAFTNPTLNSYHRLVPGFEAPVRLAYSARNRSAAIRIPVAVYSDAARRIEVRFPDASANSYLAFAALTLAAIDGIQHQIHPGDALDKDIYAMSQAELAQVIQMPGSLQEALSSLQADSEFLTKSGAFSKDFLEMWVAAKQAEIDAVRLVPHPKEFELYGDI